ncbi:capsule assembly Wzi family protein [Colwellia echini]|uniref:Capsule assembly Wzi family protein n=1 Tax=Colwellia echini TaxID=1982103 RepID=A0ABY3N1Q5_9GAMM|nr:capsule assembly Wzi family protein [Colwellia echini]TYK67411.1 capsule assembly Wzi family protein [Colwellia echini]
MLLKPILASLVIALSSLTPSLAAPWVEPDNLALRNDIQLLADAGIITAPVTTYPLMWNAIKGDIMSANTSLLNDAQLQALSHVRYNFKYASDHNNITKQTVYLATDAKRFTSFGNADFDKGDIELSDEFFVGNLAGKFQVNYRLGLDDNPDLNQGSDVNIDGSYLAYKLGNWVLTAGAIDRWWGPGVDTNLIMTTNARPLPAMSFTRDNSDAFETPWLSWIGPWTLTAQMAKLEEDRAVPDTLLWSTRATMRPFRGLEIGGSWSFQWAGEGQPSSIGDFFDILFGSKECANDQPDCDESQNTFQGNHLAGYDIRWSDTLLDLPYALYFQTIGEDGSPNAGLITDKADTYGIETRFTLFNQRVFANLEYTDTQVACGGTGTTTLNCFYEHGTYNSGYRYYTRTIGSTYDNDAQSLVATFLMQTEAGNSWQLKFRKVDLNTDNIDRYPDNINQGNSVSKVAEDVLQFDGYYKFIALDSRFTLGVLVTNSDYGNDINTITAVTDEAPLYESGTEIDAYIKWEYRFNAF